MIEFTDGISDIMTSQPEMFFNIPAHSANIDNCHTSKLEDPMIPHRDSLASGPRCNGPATASSRQQTVHTPAFRLWG